MAIVFDNQSLKPVTGVLQLSMAQNHAASMNTLDGSDRYVVLAEAHEYSQQSPVFPAISQEILANGRASFRAAGEYQTWNPFNGHEFASCGNDLDAALKYACYQSRGSDNHPSSTTHVLYLIGYIDPND